ncbi:MAG: DUF748 domain-containing protein, partial [Deltaproteobacteria bacterium]|nr:DUF748 domain-containing protein [Deltaproteobacteria bacterium]
MNRRRKVLLAIVLALLLASGGLALFLHSYFTSDRIISWIRPPLEEVLQRKVSMRQVSWGLRGFHVSGLQIGNDEAAQPLLTSQDLELQWATLSLLRGRIEIRSLVLDKPQLTVIRYANGTYNLEEVWSRLQQAGKEERRSTGVFALAATVLSMKNGKITFVDQQQSPAKILTIHHIQSQISSLSTTMPMPFEFAGRLAESSEGRFAFNGTFDLPDRRLRGKLELANIDMASIRFFLPHQGGIFRQGNLTLAATVDLVPLKFKLQGNLGVKGLTVQLASGITGAMDVASKFDATIENVEQLLEVKALDLEINDQQASVQGKLSNWDSNPQVQFTLRSSSIELDKLLQLLPGAPPDMSRVGDESAMEEESKAPARSRLQKLLELLPGTGEKSKSAGETNSSREGGAQEESPATPTSALKKLYQRLPGTQEASQTDEEEQQLESSGSETSTEVFSSESTSEQLLDTQETADSLTQESFPPSTTGTPLS